MRNQLISRNIGFGLLYLPYLISTVISFDPTLSYLTAWAGSFFIFYITFTDKVRPLSRDLPFSHQWMRPIFLPHVIFAGYMACGSIFYFLDKKGYYFFESVSSTGTEEGLVTVAKCQRLYCLGHAALTHGLLLFSNTNGTKEIRNKLWLAGPLSLKLAVFFLALSQLFRLFPAFDQFQVRFFHLGTVSVAISFALSISERKSVNTALSLLLFSGILANSFYSGMKEQLLIPFILLFVFWYPVNRSAVICLAPLSLLLFFYFLPSYNSIVREEAWFGDLTTEEASDYALEQIGNGSVDLRKKNWDFLTGRLSEIEMFEKYVEYVPGNRSFYNFQIISQSIQALVPRMISSDKAITEELVMERAYESGAFSEYSAGSAKPSPAADGYLSFGATGVWIVCLLIGVSATYISRTAESLFGGYQVGSGLVFTGLFQIFWRGNSLEFLINAVFWSLIMMYGLYHLAVKMLLIRRT